MKLVLCSEGFHTENTVEACIKLVGKPQDQIKVGIINEAYAVESGDKRWVLDNLNSVSKHFPAELDIINLLALSIDEVEKRLADVDVIFIVGGNTDYLMHAFNKSGFSELLPKLLEEKVYIGSSAGSMVVGRRISTDAYTKVYGEDQDFGVTEYMNLVDLAIKPHLDSDNFPNNRANILDEYASGTDFPVYGLRDDAAIVIDGNVQEFIGSKPHEVAR